MLSDINRRSPKATCTGPGRHRALLACSDPAAHVHGKHWLERNGLDVAIVTTAAQAMELFTSRPVDVVLVDANLRNKDGITLFSLLRGFPGGSKVPILTLCGNDLEVGWSFHKGCTDVVKKPVDWQVAGHRAAYMAKSFRIEDKLVEAQSMLKAVRSSADDAREKAQLLGKLDPLTGLLNRRAFEQILEYQLGRLLPEGGVAVFHLDLDRFKSINETYGRRGGNEILRQVAKRLTDFACRQEFMAPPNGEPTTASIARSSGDAFTMMATTSPWNDPISAAAQALVESISRPFVLGSTEVYLSASVGVAIAPTDGAKGEELLHGAELAMNEAQRWGNGTIRYHNQSLKRKAQRTLEIDRLLRQSIGRGELQLHYQPLVEAATRQVVGAEALLRWYHQDLGWVSPSEFIPVAEETGLMSPMGKWVLRTACRQLKTWIDEGLPSMRMAVNVSLCQFMGDNLLELVAEVLEDNHLETSLLELEISERGVHRSDPAILRQLEQLRGLGVRLSMDDFGTGQSAITYLRKFPVNTLKIDRSFIQGVLTNRNDAAITSAMVAMAHRLDLDVVAEGVELEEQADFLSELECEEYQGFLFSPAVPADDFRILVTGSPGTEDGPAKHCLPCSDLPVLQHSLVS